MPIRPAQLAPVYEYPEHLRAQVAAAPRAPGVYFFYAQDDSMPPALPPVVSIPLIDKSEFDVTQAMVDEWSATFPAVDVTAALLRMRTWCNANPAQRKTPRGIQSFIVRWLGKEQDSGRGGRPQTRELEGVGTFV